MSRRPTPLVLLVVLALVSAGCAQDVPDSEQGPAAEDFRMQKGGLGAGVWREPILEAEGVDVRVEPQSASAGQVVDVEVENGEGGNLTYFGSDCGLVLARPEGAEWVVFAAPQGTYHEVLDELGPGETCRTQLDLSGLQTLRDDKVERVTLPPSDYRVVFLATAGPEGNATALASASLRVQG